MNEMNQAAMRRVTLPTVPFIVAGWAGCAIVGAGWAAVGSLLGGGWEEVLIAGSAAAIVATAVLVSVLLVSPWRPKSLQTWPMVWVAGSFVRLIASIGGVYLLYSATQLGGKRLWLAAAVVYLAAMVGEARVYATSMKRIAPAPTPREDSRERGQAEPSSSE